ncbi:MAG: 16S rRNA (adenine(1518)-N(6)/adenine(1519)-N(6))-dimethyltransferase RsmA [Bifidobacteriaceae bacterium]|nr:16S rRNA (adenine(1518)-N(6)/adenine(1519)-N(6))-dimethyltransferase RsmA [Bifidobacteriaceae bacterium]
MVSFPPKGLVLIPGRPETGLLTPGAVRGLVERLALRPSKRLGQNFVVDPGIVRRIVAAARLEPNERVIEVGPGLGSLTLGLLEAGASVVAVEYDTILAAALPETIAQRSDPPPGLGDRFDLVRGDALEVEALPGRAASAMVANLPYSVATKVLLRFLERFDSIRHALVMVQSEVAARLVAGPGSRVYGLPSAKLAWCASARPAGHVPRNAFFPVPRVDSELVYLERHQPPATVSRAAVFELIDAAFAMRRKTLRVALAGHSGGAGRAEAALVRAGIDPMARGETLSIEQFARLAEELSRD